ncbi:MAG: iron-only hydrogenase system regulator [Eubacterium sp.]|nr:iron-only hydrogenase system regulator [Eubacterium sp.]
MENRVAILGIIAEDTQMADRINDILHDYNEYIVGRMGVPYRDKGIFVISVIMDAPNDAISAASGKLGMLEGVTAKAVYSKK